MALAPGSRLGPYEVIAPLGAGGMGEVYRARDTKLGRDVALKLLPDALARDPDRLARFQREAQVLASLNHPNIAAIHGLEDANGTHALVMELVEGEDLSQRIARGPLPVDEVLPIARQIAEALDAAHEQGIIHRDLKPANIKVRADGVVKVLDFGLAKLAQPETAAVGRDFSPASPGGAKAPPYEDSPTITSPARMTGIGVILGTAAYMSPEQAKGREADRRSDIWAFGAVLYEMLSGRRAFDGEDMADVLGAVVRLEPSWDALPADVPLLVRTLLQSCMVKDRGRRVADISTALFVLDKAASLAAPGTVAADRPSRPPLSRRIAIPIAAALLAGTVAATGVWFATRATVALPARVSRLLITTTGPAALSLSGNSLLAITPDGSRVAYVGNNGTQLFVRALEVLEPAVVFTSTELSQPFTSADGQWIGFVESGTLKKVAITGGPAFPLASLDGSPRGATWGEDDAIIAATANATTGLQRVTAAGGPPSVLTRPDPTQGEADHVWPERLPGGRAVLFTITPLSGGLDTAQVAVLDLQTGARTILVRGGSVARYVPSGHLVYAAAGELRAVPFDLARLQTRGTPVTVVRSVMTSAAIGVSQAVVAGDGTLAYLSGTAAELAPRTLVWVDRQGRETPIPAPPRRYVYPRLSSDGMRIAGVAIDQELDVWVWDLGRATLTRATFDAGADHSPVWTPDGLRLIFSSERAGVRNLYWQSANNTGAVERLTESANWQHASSVSPDGRHLVFTERSQDGADDIMQLALDGTHRVTPVLQSRFAERNGVVSPDGRWLAYEANDSGAFEIFVRPFPDVNSGHWQVSAAGGTRPLWTRNGQELIYVSSAGGLMSVGVTRGTSWAATKPVPVVKEGYVTMPVIDLGRTYDVGPDGRFLMVKAGGTDQSATPAGIIVVQHWGEELKRLVPTPE